MKRWSIEDTFSGKPTKIRGVLFGFTFLDGVLSMNRILSYYLGLGTHLCWLDWLTLGFCLIYPLYEIDLWDWVLETDLGQGAEQK